MCLYIYFKCARMCLCVCINSKDKQHTDLTRDGKLKQTEQVEDLRSKFEEQAREMENRYQVVVVVEVVVVEVVVADVVVVEAVVVDQPLPGEVQRPEG